MPTSAVDLARAYDRYMSALWRGESAEVHRFGAWLRGCWGLGGPPEPAGPPTAVSTLGGAGTSIRWHERDGMVFGYIPGVPHHCYRVSVADDPPAITAYANSAHVGSRW